MVSDANRLRVAVAGGVPALLGGGGLERQIDRSAAALRDRGHDVRTVVAAPADWELDVLHVFGHTADVGHLLHHWRRHPARLVVSPVVVVPRRRERRLKLATRLPIPAFEPRVLRALTTRADRLVALTAWEADLLRDVGGGRSAPVTVIGNGVDPARPLARPELEARLGTALPERYAVVVGAVSRRKRQAEIARALAGALPLVVAGGWEEGGAAERAELERAVAATGGAWLGELSERAAVDGLIAGADALVHLSEAEGQSLAVLEALALGTRCLLSDLPQQRELAARWPGLVSILPSDDRLAAAVRELAGADRAEPADVPSWDAVAAELERLYLGIDSPPRLWSERG